MDCAVIGGGVAGLASALALLRRGHRVTLLEKGTCGQESSWAGGGILSPLCPWDYPDEVTRLTGRGAALFPAWAHELHLETGIDPEYEVSGMLVLPPFERQAALQWCRTHGVRVEDDAGASHGAFHHGESIFLPEVAQVRNPRLMHALQARVEALGGRIVERCAVQDIVVESGRVQSLATSCGECSADTYVVAAGAWSKQVLGQHALHLDINPVRGQMLLFKFEVPPIKHIILQKDLYLIPRRDGHLLVGSTLENTGFDKSITFAARDDLSRRAEAILPQLHGMAPVRHWAGLRPGSPGNIPTIGRHPRLENLYINSGHFRYGVTMAPASVEILMNEMEGASQPIDVAPYQAGWGDVPA
jgi:glycine oxidase